MNKCERLMAERMNFVTHRGRTAEYQRTMWLRNLRAKRNADNGTSWTIFCAFGWQNFYGTFRQAKFEALRLANELRYESNECRVWLRDNVLNIQVWENYKIN